MLIPSIDIANGQTVQLIGGKEKALDAGDPIPLAQKFGRLGEVAVIDLDAAIHGKSNSEQIKNLFRYADCRVGGGIRDAQTAIDWLNAGASKVILGTAARPEILSQLPKERVIAALDAVHSLPDGDQGSSTDGEVVDQGWTRKTGATVLSRIKELKDLVGGFLITFVEREGRLAGIDLERVQEYLDAAQGTRLTVAGGVSTAEQIAALDRLGVDAQVGMAIYSGKLPLADAFCAAMTSDRPDGLWPTVVVNQSGVALGMVYSNQESVERSIETGVAHYWSRKRGMWKKGETSGATQQVQSIDFDCDRDCWKSSRNSLR